MTLDWQRPGCYDDPVQTMKKPRAARLAANMRGAALAYAFYLTLMILTLYVPLGVSTFTVSPTS